MSICHAPRERVSWNPQNTESGWLRWVTLHVSVWVEMETPPAIICVVFVTLHVSVWVEMRVGIGDWRIPNVTLHVSVWVEIKAEREKLLKRIGHAPRERVSWNFSDRGCRGSPPVTLHVSVWVEMLGGGYDAPRPPRHAPRERVSWNMWNLKRKAVKNVTLHVSVWVEILHHVELTDGGKVTLHVSVWVEILCWRYVFVVYPSHAPHERVGQFSFQRRTYRYWIIQITAWLRSGGIFIPKYYTFFMCFPSISPIHTPEICANKWFII